MELLLDQGLPRSTVAELAKVGVAAKHVGELGMAAASDSAILDYAAANESTVVSLDSDFHTLLAKSGASVPSVVCVRIEGLKGPEMADVIHRVLDQATNELEQGAVVSVNETTIRVRSLPIGAKPR